jgi:hypothetical protein
MSASLVAITGVDLLHGRQAENRTGVVNLAHTSVLSPDKARHEQTTLTASMANPQSRERGPGKAKGYGPLVLDVHAIPKESITPALVVIPTNSLQNLSKSNSEPTGK